MAGDSLCRVRVRWRCDSRVVAIRDHDCGLPQNGDPRVCLMVIYYAVLVGLVVVLIGFLIALVS